MEVIQYVGILLILVSAVVPFCLLKTKIKFIRVALSTAICIFAGCIFLFFPKIQELEIFKVGKITTLVKKAETDVKAINDIREDVEQTKQKIEHQINKINQLYLNILDRNEKAIDLDISIRRSKTDIIFLKKLYTITESKDYPYEDLQEEATRVYYDILKEVKYFYNYMKSDDFDFHDNTLFYFWDTKNWDIQTITAFFYKIDKELQPVYVKFIWDQEKKFTEKQRLSAIYKLLSNTNNPYVIEVACSLLKEKYKLEFDTLYSKDKYLKWCESKLNI